MNKAEYLQQLEAQLADMPEEERSEAVEFYSEYLDDAEDSAAAMEQLGMPEQLAADIRENNVPGAFVLHSRTEPQPDATQEKGGSSYQYQYKYTYPVGSGKTAEELAAVANTVKEGARQAAQAAGAYFENGDNRNHALGILMILVAIPIIIVIGGLCIALVSVLFGLLVGAGAMIFAAVAAAVGMLPRLGAYFADTLLGLGIAALLAAGGLALVGLCLKGIGGAVPALWRLIGRFWNELRERLGWA